MPLHSLFSLESSSSFNRFEPIFPPQMYEITTSAKTGQTHGVCLSVTFLWWHQPRDWKLRLRIAYIHGSLPFKSRFGQVLRRWTLRYWLLFCILGDEHDPLSSSSWSSCSSYSYQFHWLTVLTCIMALGYRSQTKCTFQKDNFPLFGRRRRLSIYLGRFTASPKAGPNDHPSYETSLRKGLCTNVSANHAFNHTAQMRIANVYMPVSYAYPIQANDTMSRPIWWP